MKRIDRLAIPGDVTTYPSGATFALYVTSYRDTAICVVVGVVTSEVEWMRLVPDVPASEVSLFGEE